MGGSRSSGLSATDEQLHWRHMTKRKKIRTDFRKNRTPTPRRGDLTRQYSSNETDDTTVDLDHDERIGKSEQTRRRTVMVDADSEGATPRSPETSTICRGRVLRVHGLVSIVEGDDGKQYQCATRRLLKTLSTDQRHVVATGDRVQFRISGPTEGIIERVEPRHGVISRNSRGRQHTLVANVDQMIIVSSAAEPYLKPNLIDRLLVTAERNHLRPVVVINKVDLIDPASLQPLIGVYSRMGYVVLPISATTGLGVDRVHHVLAGKASVVVGQSGVGKSSLLNAIEPELKLHVSTVSSDSQKGRHTTTTAQLLRLRCGGYIVDTPGVRQFQLWDVEPAEVAGYFRDLRPYVNHCRYPDCTHQHETDCAIKDAVADGRLDTRRYESYCQLYEGDLS